MTHPPNVLEEFALQRDYFKTSPGPARKRPENLPPSWRPLVTEVYGCWEDSDQPAHTPRSSTATSSLTPLDWVTANAKIVTPSLGVRPFDPHPFQARLLEDASPRRIVLKARQTGLSTVIALEALYYALHRDHDRTLFVSRNEKLAALLIQYCQVAYAGLTAATPLLAESQSKLVFANGSEILSLPANPSTGRGYPASRVYLDEFAFSSYDELIMQGILPTLSNGGQLTALSTPKGRNNLFFRLWSGIEGGAWSKHLVRWQDCPRYTEAWAEQARAEMTRQAWAEEYECDFVASGDAVFDPEDLAAARVGHDPSPDGCDRIVTGWDIGRRRDHTVGITIGRRSGVWHVLAYERVLEPYPAVQARIERRAKQFRGRVYVESNGVGDPVIENLTCHVTPFTTTPKTKVQAIQALQLLVQQGTFKHDTDQLDREMSLYQWDDDGLIQDSVIAAAIAAYAAVPPTAFGQALAAAMDPREKPEPDLTKLPPFGAERKQPARVRERLAFMGGRDL